MKLTINQALQKAIQAHRLGKIKEADRLYTAILKAQPKHTDANHNLGLLAVSVGKVNESLPFLRTALEADPTVEQFWLSYIDALMKLGRKADVKAVFDQAKSKGVTGDGFNKLKKSLHHLDLESDDTTSKAQKPPLDQVQSLIDLNSQGQFQQAIEQSEALLKQFPESAFLFNFRGAVLNSLGQLDLSITAYKKALSIKPDYAEAYNNMGVTHQNKYELEEAIEAYKKALTIKPDYAEAYNNLGNAYRDKRKPEEALEVYKRALAIKSDYAVAHNNLGNALNDQGNFKEAIEAYEKALTIQPDYAEAYYNIGNTLKEQGKLEEAIKAYKQALSIKPDYAECFNNIGVTLEQRGKLEEAIGAFEKALAIKPFYTDALENALGLRIQLFDSNVMGEAISDLLANRKTDFIGFPKFQIQQAINAFLFADKNLVIKHLTNYKNCRPNIFTRLKKMDRIFCSAFHGFLSKLIQTSDFSNENLKTKDIIFHVGESHCLSYAHQRLKLNGIAYKVVPKITFGGKAFHFSSEEENSFKAITQSNLDMLPNGSKVFISFGEIDCRPNEGFISAASKFQTSIKPLIDRTIDGYLNWFVKHNLKNKHSLFFFNVPAPSYRNDITPELNTEVVRTVRECNIAMKKYSELHNLTVIDVNSFTSNEHGYSNMKYHIDGRHLGAKAIPLIESQLN